MPEMPTVFRSRAAGSRAEARKRFDADRGSAHERGYGARWARASGRHKAAHPLCVGCQAVGRVVAATVTDHVVPHRGNDRLFWDEGNWQSCCDRHHNVVKQRLEAMWDRGSILAADLRLDSAAAVGLTRRLLEID